MCAPLNPQEGINWLAFLRRFGLHGVLADDMGLGKTLQASAIIGAAAIEQVRLQSGAITAHEFYTACPKSIPPLTTIARRHIACHHTVETGSYQVPAGHECCCSHGFKLETIVPPIVHVTSRVSFRLRFWLFGLYPRRFRTTDWGSEVILDT